MRVSRRVSAPHSSLKSNSLGLSERRNGDASDADAKPTTQLYTNTVATDKMDCVP